MLFNSHIFILFFILCVVIHYLPLNWTIRKLNLLLASYVFYAAWNPPFVILLILAAVVDFNLANLVARTERVAGRKAILVTSVTLNLGLLGFFKYGQFLTANFAYLLSLLNIQYHPPSFDVILPLGISFYTFETISYLIDVYRRRVQPTKSFLDYALFLTFFPHLVAGPIIRAYDFLPQCEHPKKFSSRMFGWGLVLMIIGLFEKVVLADGLCAPVVDSVYNSASKAKFIEAWVGTLAFSGQIYFDFAGYSICGIGAALCLGFVLKGNFHFPYAAAGFSDFWRRWHISLSSWLRDYLYVSLGGNRKGKVRTYINLALTMLLGGLWHGASWKFVVWGGMHGLYLVCERLLKGLLGEKDLSVKWVFRIPVILVTFFLVCLTWVFFRGANFSDAFYLIGQMFSPQMTVSLVSNSMILQTFILILGLISFQFFMRDTHLATVAEKVPAWVTWGTLSFIIITLIVVPGDNRAFIYFQF